jgi:hypothetical protein
MCGFQGRQTFICLISLWSNCQSYIVNLRDRLKRVNLLCFIFRKLDQNKNYPWTITRRYVSIFLKRKMTTKENWSGKVRPWCNSEKKLARIIRGSESNVAHLRNPADLRVHSNTYVMLGKSVNKNEDSEGSQSAASGLSVNCAAAERLTWRKSEQCVSALLQSTSPSTQIYFSTQFGKLFPHVSHRPLFERKLEVES